MIASAYLAADGFEAPLAEELERGGVRVESWHGRLALSPDPPRPAAWALDIWTDPREIAAPSVKAAADALRAIQRNWAGYAALHHRRSALIAERLPPVKARPLVFPEPPPGAHLGAWTLLEPDRLLASPTKSSPFVNGECRFVEDRAGPPSRAYLKLWEAWTRLGAWPAPGETCLDLGASPGGWSWAAAQLGARVTAVDKAPLDPVVAAMPGVAMRAGSAFALDPEPVDWLLSDVVAYPARMLAMVTRWIDAGAPRHVVCTLKFQGATDHEAAAGFAAIPGGRVVHLFHNKHELTFLWPAPGIIFERTAARLTMQTRQLGRSGPPVSAIGLGCMGMSDAYGRVDRGESVATIHAALDAGVTLFDTGDFYGSGDNEMLLGEALAERRSQAFIQVKFGALRDPKGGWLGYDARPAAVKSALAYTLRRLRTDYIDLYQPARLDPNVPIEDTIGAIAEMVQAGHVRHVGLSEVGAATIRRAHAVHPIAALQIEYSLVSRSIEAEILPTCRALGIALNPYGVLSRGLLAGSRSTGPGDGRERYPRFQGEAGARNATLADALRRLAAERGATPVQLAVAWVLSRGADIVPLIGARRRAQLHDALGALDLALGPDDLARIEAAVPAEAVAGTRYPEAQMATLDSEKT